MSKLLCLIGWHSWFKYGPQREGPVRKCHDCGKLQEGVYDMSYGCTNWEDL